MYYASHNCFTGYSIKGWYKLIWPIAKIGAECQHLSATEQYKLGCRYFQLQIAHNGKDWYISHGIVLYNVTLQQALEEIQSCLTEGDRVYIELVLDNNFFLKQASEEEFNKVIEYVQNFDKRMLLYKSILEKEWKVTQYLPEIGLTMQFWTMSWAKQFNNLLYRIPLPKYWAKRNNKTYKEQYKDAPYLMLDFIDIPNDK